MKLRKTLLALGIATLAFTTACSSDEPLPTVLSFHPSEEDATRIVEMIDAITVADMTTEQEIENIYLEYCKLDSETQELVTNYEKLDEYRNQITKLYYTEPLQGPRMDRSKVNIGTYCFTTWTDESVQTLVDCGIDFIANASYNETLLNLLNKYNVGAFVSGAIPGWYGGGGDRAKQVAGTMSTAQPVTAYDSYLESYVDYDCIWAIDLGDEPSPKDIPHYGDVVEHIKDTFPNQLLYLNLLPRGGSFDTGPTEYAQHLHETVEYCNFDYLCYDRYPYHEVETDEDRYQHLNRWLYNIHEASRVCNEEDVDLWIVVAASGYNPGETSDEYNRYLYEDEIRIQSSLALTYGARVITWACWDSGWFAHYIVDKEGNPNEIYPYVQKVNEEIDKLSPIYSRYDNVCNGYIHTDPARLHFAYCELAGKRSDSDQIPESWERLSLENIENCPVKDVSTSINANIIAGYFEKRDGNGAALMFTNMTDYFCEEESLRPVYFTVNDPEAKVLAYYNGEAFEPEYLGNGQYVLNIENSDNIFVTIE